MANNVGNEEIQEVKTLSVSGQNNHSWWKHFPNFSTNNATERSILLYDMSWIDRAIVNNMNMLQAGPWLWGLQGLLIPKIKNNSKLSKWESSTPSLILSRTFNPIKAGLLKVVFPDWGSIWAPLHISRRTYLISIKLYTIVKQSIWSMLKVKKFWYHLL